MNDARSAYLETQVLTAAPQKLQLMLIDGGIRFAHQAREAHAAGNAASLSDSLDRARDIVAELIASIRPDGLPVSNSARAVYGFIFQSLAEAQLLKNPQKIDDAVRVLEEERQTWLAVCELDVTPPGDVEAFRQQEVVARDFATTAAPAGARASFSLDA